MGKEKVKFIFEVHNDYCRRTVKPNEIKLTLVETIALLDSLIDTSKELLNGLKEKEEGYNGI